MLNLADACLFGGIEKMSSGSRFGEFWKEIFEKLCNERKNRHPSKGKSARILSGLIKYCSPPVLSPCSAELVSGEEVYTAAKKAMHLLGKVIINKILSFRISNTLSASDGM